MIILKKGHDPDHYHPHLDHPHDPPLHQLAGYLGIPVIGWNADNSGLERRVSAKY